MILEDLTIESQIGGHTGHRVDGLRALAKMIAHDLLAKRQDNTTIRNDREASDTQISKDCR